MKLNITNEKSLDAWINERLRIGHDMVAIKGAPPNGAAYSDGEPIIRQINIAWRDATTGEVFAIEYEGRDKV